MIGFISLQWLKHIGGPEQIVGRFGAAGPIMTMTIQLILALTPFPSDVIAIAHGAIFGFLPGAIYSWTSWWLASILEFGLGRRVRNEFDLDSALSKAPERIRSFPISHPIYLILSRQIPWLGGHVSTFVPGAAGVSWQRYLWCSAIAIIPGSLILAALGARIIEWTSA